MSAHAGTRTGERIDRRSFLQGGLALALTACAPGRTTPVSPGALPAGSTAETGPLDALATAEAISRGESSRLEVFETAVTRIADLDERLGFMAQDAIARASERLASSEPPGVFSGVPTLLKDLVDCEGVIRSDGASPAFWRTPSRSPALVRALEASGLVVLGSTNVPEFATLPVTVNRTFGATRNPWDPVRTPGGSSGGSAVAVAAGVVPIAHATDGAGSIRMPASCCGVFGFKPSRARSVSGEQGGGHPLLKHHHCLTRSVRDSVAFLSVTEDRSAGARYPSIFAEGWPTRRRRPRRLRIGVDRAGIAHVPPDGRVAAALEDALSLLRDLGHEVVEQRPLTAPDEPFWDHLEALFLDRMPGLVARIESETGLPFDRTGLLSPFTESFARASLREPAGATGRALAYLDGLALRADRWLEGVDVVVSPVLPETPPLVDRWSPQSDWMEARGSIRAFMNHVPLANVIGAPAMSVPLHWTSEGWPIGTHFQARPGQDRLLFDLAFELEAARPWGDRWPAISVRGG